MRSSLRSSAASAGVGTRFFAGALRAASALLLAGGLVAGLGATPALASQPHTGTTLYAEPDNGATVGDCTEQASPCDLTYTLSLVESTSGDTIMLESGDPYDGSFEITGLDTSVTVEAIDLSTQADIELEDTNGGSVFSLASGDTLTLDDVAVSDTTGVSGAAVIVGDGATLDAVDCTFDNDKATADGGAIDSGDGSGEMGTVTITDSTFSDDSATGDGGAIDSGDNGGSGTLAVMGSLFLDDSDTSDGGAIDSGDNRGTGMATITDTEFQGDTANDDNGGAVNSGGAGGTGTVTASGSSFDSNSAGSGGAISSGNGGTGTISVTSSSFVDNSVSSDGGAIDSGDGSGKGTATIDTSTFAGNGGSDGGAIANGVFSSHGALTVLTSTLDGNSATDGGAIDSGDDTTPGSYVVTATVTSSTFSDNRADTGDGASVAGALDDGTGTITLAADILADARVGGECSGSVSDDGYNVSDDKSCPFLASDYSVSDSPALDSYVGPLTDNGGSTDTVALVPAPASSTVGADPALDVVPASVDIPGTEITVCSQDDQRGDPRSVPCDIGAFDQGSAMFASAAGGSTSGCPEQSPCSLTAALAQASSQTITLASGTYEGNFDVDTSVALEAAAGATVVLDGGGLGSVLDVADGENVVLDDLTVTDGSATDGGGVDLGAGASLVAADCTFSDDAAIADGGAIDSGDGGSHNGAVSIDESTFAGDTAGYDGGAIDSGDGGAASLVVTDSAFSGDTAGSGGAISSGNGGGEGTASVDDSTFSGDTATHDGGGIDSGDGGGTGTLVVTGSTFSDLTGNFGGAIASGLDGSDGTLSVESSTFAGDSADNNGGAIDTGDDISDQGATGVSSSAVIASTTFSADAAGAEGAAIDSGDNDGTATTTLAADIVAGATGATECHGTITDGGYNVDNDGSCDLAAENGSTSDSAVIGDYLGPLENNGGPTETFALLTTPSPTTTSPDPAAAVVPVGLTVPGTTTAVCSLEDQRGDRRETTDCDMGAYDAWSTTSIAASATTVALGGTVIFTAQVINGEPSGTSGGSVIFTVGTSTGSAVSCGAGSAAFSPKTDSATCVAKLSTLGGLDVVATWSGDGNEPSSSSPAVAVTVVGLPTAKISSPASGGTYYVGEVVATSFSCADSASAPGLESPGGCSDGVSTSGRGRLVTSKRGRFTYTVTATSKDGGTGTAHISYTVEVAPSKVTLSLSTKTATFGKEQVVQLRAAVVSPPFPSVAPGGAILFKAGNTTLCSIVLRSGKATCTLSADKLAPGTYSLTALYDGSTAFAASRSSAAGLTISKAVSVVRRSVATTLDPGIAGPGIPGPGWRDPG